MSVDQQDLSFSGTWDDGTSFHGDVVVDYALLGQPGGVTGSVTSSYATYATASLMLTQPSSGSYDIEGYIYHGHGNYDQIDLTYAGEAPAVFDSGVEKMNAYSVALMSVFSTHALNASAITATGTAPCFAAGTSIATRRGDVSVETLAIGDEVVTASGEHRPIRWLGHRTIDCRRHAKPETVWPIRVLANAFGRDRPARDLYLSPGHAICVSVVDDVLIPACALVNGATIVQVEVDTVTYWHVELGSHDVLLAEHLPTESYLDVGNRGFFVEAGVADLAAQPDGSRATQPGSTLPFIDCGPVLDAVRIGLRARALKAGWTLDREPFAGLHLVADGTIVHADIEGLTARFVLPASAADVWLVSEISVPFDVGDNPDRRRLGVSLRSLTIDDGLAPRRAVALDDARLRVGFHPVERLEAGERRWTEGRAQLPAALWAGCRGSFFLRIELTGPALPRWVAPLFDASTAPRRASHPAAVLDQRRTGRAVAGASPSG